MILNQSVNPDIVNRHRQVKKKLNNLIDFCLKMNRNKNFDLIFVVVFS